MKRGKCAASTGTACGNTPLPQVLHKMPPKRPFSVLGTQRQRATRIEHLEAAVAASLCEEYRAELQPDGSILLVPQDYSRPTDTTPDIKSEALRVLWRMRSSQMSRRDMAYLLPDLDSTVSWADVAPWLKHLSHLLAGGFVSLRGSMRCKGRTAILLSG